MAKKQKPDIIPTTSNSCAAVNCGASTSQSNQFALKSENHWMTHLLNPDSPIPGPSSSNSVGFDNYAPDLSSFFGASETEMKLKQTTSMYGKVEQPASSIFQPTTSLLGKIELPPSNVFQPESTPGNVDQLMLSDGNILLTTHGFSPSFPDNWCETKNKEFFNTPSCMQTSAQCFGSIPTHQMSCPSGKRSERETITYRSLSCTDSFAAASSADYPEFVMGSCTNQPTSSLSPKPSTSYAHERATRVRKKRSRDEQTYHDSDSDVSDDDSVFGNEDDEELRIRTQRFAAKFLELRQNRKQCNFWQYNSQSRGPKGRRIYGEIALKDCHVLDEFVDPVRQSEVTFGQKQASKLRHGEGNDPRPQLFKLIEIGARIYQLEDEFCAVNAGQGSTKEEANREKNKLASRVCRLKKKAQHEANKVKLEGLREEHQQLIAVIAKSVLTMEQQFGTADPSRLVSGESSCDASQEPVCSQLERLIQTHLQFMIAGHTSEYVNTQIEKAARRYTTERRFT